MLSRNNSILEVQNSRLMRRNRRNEPEHVRQARRKVRSKKWFFRHFSIYLVISIFFFCMNMLDSPHDPWFLYPVISWGTLIGIQYLWTFGLPFTKAGTREWEERELARELAKSAPGYQDPQDYQEEASGFDDILDAVLFDEFKTLTKDEILDKYKRASTAEERQSILRFAEMLKQQGQ